MAWENLFTRVEASIKERLEKYCQRNDVSIRQVVEDAVIEYLDRREKGNG